MTLQQFYGSKSQSCSVSSANRCHAQWVFFHPGRQWAGSTQQRRGAGSAKLVCARQKWAYGQNGTQLCSCSHPKTTTTPQLLAASCWARRARSLLKWCSAAPASHCSVSPLCCNSRTVNIHIHLPGWPKSREIWRPALTARNGCLGRLARRYTASQTAK